MGKADYDLIVYAGTPGGVAAACSAADADCKVLLIETTGHLGGLSTSGLNRDEGEHMNRATLGGLSEHFTREAARRSGADPDTAEARVWESRIAEAVFDEMVGARSLQTLRRRRLAKVERDGSAIAAILLDDGSRLTARLFVDATYEGDLLAAAGVGYDIGREAVSTYGESRAGVRYLDPPVPVSPYDQSGNLLPGVLPGEPPPANAESPIPTPYNIRHNLSSDPRIAVPIERPQDYDPREHELLGRCFAAGLIDSLEQVLELYPLPGAGKRECNNRQFSYVSMSMPGAQKDWTESGPRERAAIHARYERYTHGLYWFLQTDPRVPTSERERMAGFGLCGDEWTDNGHWPWYLYVRAGRRMRGAYRLTEQDIVGDRDKHDRIHVGSHFIDSHHVARYAVDRRHFVNEGRLWRRGRTFDIPYRILTPNMQECTNLLVPVAASASATAFCALRVEPTWMHFGEVCGQAAALALQGDLNVQNVDIDALQTKVHERGIPLDVPKYPVDDENDPEVY
jgi:hypothetical protein